MDTRGSPLLPTTAPARWWGMAFHILHFSLLRNCGVWSALPSHTACFQAACEGKRPHFTTSSPPSQEGGKGEASSYACPSHTAWTLHVACKERRLHSSPGSSPLQGNSFVRYTRLVGYGGYGRGVDSRGRMAWTADDLVCSRDVLVWLGHLNLGTASEKVRIQWQSDCCQSCISHFFWLLNFFKPHYCHYK